MATLLRSREPISEVCARMSHPGGIVNALADSEVVVLLGYI